MRRPSLVRQSYLLLAAAAMLALPGLALACSGPGAMAAIVRAERLGWILWATTLVLAGGSAFIPRLRSRGWRRQWPLLLLVVLHPGWWMSARSGDCGRTLVEGSVLITALTPLVVGFLFWRSRRAARQSDRSSHDPAIARLEEAIRAYERGEPWALGQLRRWLDTDSAPEQVLADSRRMLDLAKRVHEAPADLVEFRKEIDVLLARIDRLPRDVL